MRALIPGVTIKGLPCVIVQHSAARVWYVYNGKKLRLGRKWLDFSSGEWLLSNHSIDWIPPDWYRRDENEAMNLVYQFCDYRDMPEYDQHDQDESIIDQGGLNDTTEGTGNSGRDDLPDPGSEREP